MIYTVGHTANYNKALDTNPHVRKLGREHPNMPPDFAGGIAFQTIEEANAYLIEIGMEDVWSVFTLDCQWDNTYHFTGDNTFRIINTAEVNHLNVS